MNDTTMVIPATGEKYKIVFVIPTLDKGGAERVLVNFVNEIDLSLYEPVIFCLKKKGDLLGLVKPGITVLDMDRPRIYFCMFKISREIKKVNPDAVIGWLGNVNSSMAFFRWLLPRKLTIMCRESSIPSLFNHHYRFPFIFDFMYRFYNRFDAIIAQSTAMKEDLVQHFKVKPGKIRIINNPVAIAGASAEIDPDLDSFIPANGKCLLFVGRFSKEKQIELLLELMLLLPADYYLVLVGYGPLETSIRGKIGTLHLETRVRIISNCTNPAPYYQKADCFLLCSAFEGFPNVVLEANAQGCPAIVYKTVGGAKEILTGTNGVYIAPGEENTLMTFAKTVTDVCTNKEKYNRKNIAGRIKENYSTSIIADRYLAYIKETIHKKRQPGK
jgi:glycosyltransferase involved in cell wall biosynthesis